MIVNGQYKMVGCTRQEIFTAYNLVEILFIRVRAFTSLFLIFYFIYLNGLFKKPLYLKVGKFYVYIVLTI